MLYLRHKAGEDRRSPKGRFPALESDHPLIDRPCLLCGEFFTVGDTPTLFVIGPDDPDEAEKADDGRWYTAFCGAMHQHCAWPS